MEKRDWSLLCSAEPLSWEQWSYLNLISRSHFFSSQDVELQNAAQKEMFSLRMQVLERGLLDLHARLNNHLHSSKDEVPLLWIQLLLCDVDPMDRSGKPKEHKSGLELNSHWCLDQDRVSRFVDRVCLIMSGMREKMVSRTLYESAARCRIPDRGVLQQAYLQFISDAIPHEIIRHILSELSGLSELSDEPLNCDSALLFDIPLQHRFRQIAFEVFGVSFASTPVIVQNTEELILRIKSYLFDRHGRVGWTTS